VHPKTLAQTKTWRIQKPWHIQKHWRIQKYWRTEKLGARAAGKVGGNAEELPYC
jgi:hypothetical protein